MNTAILAALVALPGLYAHPMAPGLVVSHTGLVGKLAVLLSTPRSDGTIRVGWIGVGNELNVSAVFTRGCTASPDQSLGPVILARYNATLYGRQS